MSSFYGTCDLFGTKLFIPTVVRCQGWTRRRGPLLTVDTAEIDEIARSLIFDFRRGNPEMSEEEIKRPVDDYWAEASGIKSWPVYSKKITNWNFGEHDGIYQISRYKRVRGGGLVPDPDEHIILPQDTRLESACDQFARIIKARADEVAAQSR